MPRRPRLDLPPGVFHIHARGSRRGPLCFDRADRITYLSMLADTVGIFEWRCLAYCLMTNHVHLLLETTHANLSQGMQRFHGKYAQRLNQRHRMSGHVFERRFGAVPAESDAQIWMTARYIALNPVAAGICRRPEEYEWSSYGGVMRGRAPQFVDVPRLLGYFAAAGGDGLTRYRELVTGPSFLKRV